jgi:hypothetical protein
MKIMQMVQVRDVKVGDCLATPEGPVAVSASFEDLEFRYEAPCLGVGGFATGNGSPAQPESLVQFDSSAEQVAVWVKK